MLQIKKENKEMKKVFVLSVIVIFIFTGCSEEKAQGVLTVVKSFEAKSLQAISAYETLFKDSVYLEKKSNDEIFDLTSAAIKKYGKEAVTFERLIQELSSREQNQLNQKIKEEFDEIKTLYKKIGNTYDSLSLGNLASAKYLSCSRDIVAKAIIQLVNFSVFLNENPLYGDKLKKDVASYKNLIVKEENSKAKLLLQDIANEVITYDEKHENAFKLTFIAVEEGEKLHSLLGTYKDVSLEDILSITQSGFDLVSTVEGIDISKISEKLLVFKKQFSEDEYWKRVSNISIFELEECK
jgi:nitrogenase molybdenum-iron protein alpha/beta subunit